MARESDTAEPCPDGEHDPAWDPSVGTTVCRDCDRSAETIVNDLGHDLY